jgi:hypothetical protein
MRLNQFATLQRGDKIKVKTLHAGPVVFTVCGEPHSGNTLIEALDAMGTKHNIYFRDVVKFNYPEDQF